MASIVKRQRWQKLYDWATAAVGVEQAGASQALELAVAAPYFADWHRRQRCDILDWLKLSIPPELTSAIDVAEAQPCQTSPDVSVDFNDGHAYERLLTCSNATQRRRQGVYYTPTPLADFIVRTLHQRLIDTFGLATGFACEDRDATTGQPRVNVLDPALGSGVFLLAVIRLVHAQQLASLDREAWNRHHLPNLLARLHGWELIRPALWAAVLQLTVVLERTGFDFQQPIAIPWRQRDALAPPKTAEWFPFILGNPPYGSLSTAQHGWIEGLISDSRTGYTTLHGEPLAEKKHWLHDDYVKFFRLAQWHVDQCGYGAVGFVTNHSYLDNVTFRGMRASLLSTFAQSTIIDLQGNAKRRRRGSPNDENVFGIASGVALNLWMRPHQHGQSREIQYASLTGTKEEKLTAISAEYSPITAPLFPQPPLYLLSPRAVTPAEYAQFPSILEIMPFSASVPVTARDHFVVAYDEPTLRERLEQFADLSIPDDRLRERWFQRTRSARYAQGDTRSWKLSEARRRFAADPQALSCIRPVQYRPLDVRYIAWHEALIDWPRVELCRHLALPDNLALIVRRQSPDHLPAHYFWVTQQLPLDGILRSDQRGNETVLPLWLQEDSFATSEARRPNFSATWLARLAERTGLDFSSASTVGSPRHCLAYIYSHFFSAEYRETYHTGIVHDFPRVPDPHNAADFLWHAERGAQLLAWHTSIASKHTTPASYLAHPLVAAGYPRWEQGHVFINREQSVATLSEEVWNVLIGAHQVACKWLKDRRGQRLTPYDVSHYTHVLDILTKTQQSRADNA
jgi:predicted helicase